MALAHLFDTVQNRNTGVPIPGVVVRMRYQDSDGIAPIYANEIGTPFPVANETTTDADGMFSLYADAGLKYRLLFYIGDTLYKSIDNVSLGGGEGGSGPANSSYATTTELKDALASNLSAILTESGKSGTFVIRNYSDYVAQVAADTGQINYIRSSSDTTKVWVRSTIIPDNGAGKISATDGTVQQSLDARPKATDLAASAATAGAALIGFDSAASYPAGTVGAALKLYNNTYDDGIWNAPDPITDDGVWG